MAATTIKVIFGYHYNSTTALTDALTTKYRTYGTNLSNGSNYPKTYQFDPETPSHSTSSEAYTQFIRDMTNQAYEYYTALTYSGTNYGITITSSSITNPNDVSSGSNEINSLTTIFNTINGLNFNPKYKMNGQDDIFAGVEIKSIPISGTFSESEANILTNNLIQYNTYHLSNDQINHLKEIARYLGRSDKPQFYIFAASD